MECECKPSISQSESIQDLAKALNSAQKLLGGSVKSANNPFFKSRYSDLGDVWEAVREPLTSNGLSVVQYCEGEMLVTQLMHESGQWIRGFQKLYIEKSGPQSAGSAMSYARRYGLAAMLGIYQSDDDAEAATPPEGRPQSEETPENDQRALYNKACHDFTFWITEKNLLDEEERNVVRGIWKVPHKMIQMHAEYAAKFKKADSFKKPNFDKE